MIDLWKRDYFLVIKLQNQSEDQIIKYILTVNSVTQLSKVMTVGAMAVQKFECIVESERNIWNVCFEVVYT
jgi:hypothetical protein